MCMKIEDNNYTWKLYVMNFIKSVCKNKFEIS